MPRLRRSPGGGILSLPLRTRAFFASRTKAIPACLSPDSNRVASFEELPNELKLEIISYLTIKDIGEVSRVNRRFYHLVSHKSNRDALARARIIVSLERFHDSIHEHITVANSPVLPALEYFLERRGLPETPEKRLREAFIFASLRTRDSPACRPDGRLLTQMKDLARELIDLHINQHVIIGATDRYFGPICRCTFVKSASRKFSYLQLTEEVLSAMYLRISERPLHFPVAVLKDEWDEKSRKGLIPLTSLPSDSHLRRFDSNQGLGSREDISRALGIELPVIPLGDLFGYCTFKESVREKLEKGLRGEQKPFNLAETAALLEEMSICDVECRR